MTRIALAACLLASVSLSACGDAAETPAEGGADAEAVLTRTEADRKSVV